ncbi:N2,N2-dimethylguanosine tRNA methyltransferase [Flagelloscypha sp. PMI_526]|nr:N2,N2-dimethylguanosine tRNA methyltransferase [Flagelloscypha sp. PMI_526]
MTMPSIVVPEGFRLHSENTTHILLGEDDAFLNPVQEFNRDLSVACIKTWSQQSNELRTQKALTRGKKVNHSKRPKERCLDESAQDGSLGTSNTATSEYVPSHRITILEPLSATGLRAIRYAKEIPLVKLNGISAEITPANPCVEVVEGDACTLMYTHRQPSKRVEVVDLDPYGTAAPFIDAAVQCVADGGLLCITCTDLAVLATTNNAEKWYSNPYQDYSRSVSLTNVHSFTNYGGLPMKTEYCHEGALRLVLHTVSTSASRYGRYITPLLSLSIDFYVRLWIKVDSKPIEVKKALGHTATYYVCSFCQSHYEQPLGKIIEKSSSYVQGKVQQGPPVSNSCPECNSALHVAGPMWSGPIHQPEFASRVLAEVEANEDKYGTAARMKGMLTVAKECLCPFYFSPGKLSSFFRCTTISLDDFSSALLHDGHRVSRSHALAGSLKTDAPRNRIHDIMRTWCQRNPEGAPSRTLRHPSCASLSSKIKLVRYQEHPPNWGPAKKAGSSSKKRKRGVEHEAEDTMEAA